MGGAGKLAPNAGVWPWRAPETDTTPGATPGTWEELGNWHFAQVFGPGGRRKRVPPGGNSWTWEELGNRHFARVLGPDGRPLEPGELGNWPAW